MKISNKVIVILSIILVILSFVNTFLVFTYVNNAPTTTPSEGSGVVTLTIINPENPSQPSRSSGVVALEIKKT
ncbi:MAG: hypothetical protein QW754_06130 [Thermoplasmata archaeon]